MKIKIFENEVPDSARRIRTEVFVDEQGFCDEFDEKDAVSTHFVLFDSDGTPIATSRIFRAEEADSYYIGRIAVIASMRGKGLGKRIVATSEDYIRSVGGKTALIHAQSRVADFYANIGYTEYGERDEEQGCPHVWMQKRLQ